jgi:hypothetical protein
MQSVMPFIHLIVVDMHCDWNGHTLQTVDILDGRLLQGVLWAHDVARDCAELLAVEVVL